VYASEVSDNASFLIRDREAGPRMLTIGTNLSDGVTDTAFVADAHAPRKLHSVAWMLYCWPSIRRADGTGLGGVIV
jgi:hypothetical protein